MEENIMQEEIQQEETQQQEEIQQEEIQQEEQAEQAETRDNAEPSPEKTFTQAELDDIIQKRLDRERRKLESDPRLTFLNKQAEKYGMSVDEYLEAVRQAEEQERINELVNQGIPDDVAKEIMESRKFRKEWEAERKAQEEQKRKEADYKAFLETFPDVDPKDIPPKVWEEVGKGKSLVDAYTRHENQKLKEQLKQFQQAQETAQKNQENSESSTGSVTGNDTGKTPFFTREQVAKMTTEEVMKNYDAIMTSRKHWK
jgi:colicin import membrane protein